jgi:formylglycine-generating enzyme required for sulfatase activity/serine/threonine protein kinase
VDLSNAIIGQYHIIEQIGRGGMATVYKAYQPNLDRYVAIKALTPGLVGTKGFIARFEREARAVARLRHRNILTVFDYGRQGDMFYLVMEYVSGGTLMGRLGWPQDLTYAVNIVSQVGDALAHAHRQGMIHRDVKPGNILMAEEDWPLLSDFGLAKMVEDSIQLTASGASVGTPQYMSPEQARGLEVDRRTDIYSLGTVLYEAVTGRPPFGTDSPMAVILRQINEPITPPHILRSDLPKEVERVILKALAKSPADRYQRMEEFLADLQETCPLPANHNMVHLGDAQARQGLPAAFRSVPTPIVTPRLPRRRAFPWVKLAIGIVLLLTLALALMLKTSMAPQVPSPTMAAVESHPTPETSPTMAAVESHPTPQTVEVRVWEADDAEMVFVPAGEFVMGSEELGDDERPVHRIYLDDFWIDRYEVTNERFARFVVETGYQTDAERRGRGWVWVDSEWEEVEGADWRHPGGPDTSIEDKMDHPVVLTSWNDADVYCRWVGKRLPSEAQWEKAARGTDGRRYAWGEEFDSAQANTKGWKMENGEWRGSTTPVGSFSPQGDSPYGASDMAGNVWEWVADWYGSDYYSLTTDGENVADNPPGPAAGTDKVLRGGSWAFDEVYARTSFRYNVKPDYTYDFAGFRCSSQEVTMKNGE